MDDFKKLPKMKTGGSAKPGLYANIHAKQERIAHGSGERMRKPGSAGAPTKEAFVESAKTAKKATGGSVKHDEPIAKTTTGKNRHYLSTKEGAGMTEAGRKAYNAKNGSHLKAPQPEGGSRKDSFCARMSGVKGPMKDENGKPTRKAAALKRWKC
jgi:hypothetical protein